MIEVNNHIAQLQLRIEKTRWFIEMGKRALAASPDDCELLISHQNMRSHLESLEDEIRSALHNAAETVSYEHTEEPLRQAFG